MKRNLVTLTLFIASFFCSTACLAADVVKEKRETGAFQKISSSNGIDVYFTQSDTYSVVVEANEDYIDKIATEVDGETLVIRRKGKRGSWGSLKNVTLNVHVSAPALDAASVSGGSDFYADDLKCDKSFRLSASGGADVHLKNLTVADDADISVSGGADVDIKSLTVAATTNVTTSGGADSDIASLQTGDCHLSASGGGDIDVKLLDSNYLRASASGGGDIDVSGKAADVKISASGGGDANIRNLTYSTIDITKSGGGDVNR
jgi:hypothetical protein